ncbi:MAG: glycosyltransferase family 4 protein [Gemmatimonadota bacterium]
MRILMIAPQPFFRPRGTPFSVLHRIRALTRLGHRVDLVTYPFGESPAIEGLTIHRAARPPVVRDVAIGPSIAKLLLDIPVASLALRLARTQTFDMVHSHEEAGLLGSWLQRRTGLPHLYDMHSSLPQQFSTFGRWNLPGVVRLFESVERFTLSGAAGVIAVCPELAEHVATTPYAGPLEMIENTMDFDVRPPTDVDIDALRARLGLGDAPVVAYTGTLEPYQGMDILVDAARVVAGAVPDARFVIVGGHPDQVVALQATVDRAGLTESFVLVGSVAPQAVFGYLALADALVTCRLRGTNTPLKIYQYMRSGRPIVATDIRSHTQVLEPTTAELVEVEAGAIARGLVRVLTDPQRARALAREAGRVAEERYGERPYMEALERIVDATARAAGQAAGAA